MGDEAAIFSRHGRVEALEVDDRLLEHLADRAVYAKHRVSATEVLEAHAGAPKYFVNEGHRAPVVMVGPAAAGRLLCVPIEPTGRFGVWRPVTAFEANAHHRDRYRRG